MVASEKNYNRKAYNLAVKRANEIHATLERRLPYDLALILLGELQRVGLRVVRAPGPEARAKLEAAVKEEEEAS